MNRSRQSILDELDALESGGLRRSRRVRRAQDGVCFDLSSNDYLGFASSPVGVRERGGAGASALVSGHWDVHEETAALVATWLGAEGCQFFTSGYAANVGVLSGLADRGDLIISDRLNHASLIDGCRLARAEVVVAPHLEVGFVEDYLRAHRGQYRRVFLVTESYFSMDGDSPDFGALRALADRYECLWVLDEAHAIGVFGDEGRGLAAVSGVQPDVTVGTLGKAFGLQGAFVVAKHEILDLLWNRARSFVFSTALSPVLVAELRERLPLVRGAEDRRRLVAMVSARVRSALAGRVPAGSYGPIVPWLAGDERRAVELQAELLESGILVGAIRPPTVPKGGARLRIVASYPAALEVDHWLGRLEETLQRFT